jgi:hypothetical protein
MELLILIVLVLIWLKPSKEDAQKAAKKVAKKVATKAAMTTAQRELSAQWASERKHVAVLKNVERSVLLEDVERLLARVGDERLAEALGVHHSVSRSALIERAADLGRDGAYAIAVANREVA